MTTDTRRRFWQTHCGDLEDLTRFLFTHPEPGFKETQAAAAITALLEQDGFTVTRGYGGLDTAFAASKQYGTGGPHIGLLCEYDALPNFGHGCAHHLQPACMIGAARILEHLAPKNGYTLSIIGTPAEESAEGGKHIMIRNGAFRELDVALMMHGSDCTTTDVRSLACIEMDVTFHGTASHAAIAPELGRSALEAAILTTNGLAFLRGHVKDDVRIHYMIKNGGSAVNIVADTAVLTVELRAGTSAYLHELLEWFYRILDGACLMTGTTHTLCANSEFLNKIPVLSLNDLLMKHAHTLQAPAITPPREKTGSTDFAAVMHLVPGSSIRVAFIQKGITAHTQEWLDQGLSDAALDASRIGAEILAYSCRDLIDDPALLSRIQADYAQEKAAMLQK